MLIFECMFVELFYNKFLMICIFINTIFKSLILIKYLIPYRITEKFLTSYRYELQSYYKCISNIVMLCSKNLKNVKNKINYLSFSNLI